MAADFTTEGTLRLCSGQAAGTEEGGDGLEGFKVES